MPIAERECPFARFSGAVSINHALLMFRPYGLPAMNALFQAILKAVKLRTAAQHRRHAFDSQEMGLKHLLWRLWGVHQCLK